MFERHKKEWQIYKFIKANQSKLVMSGEDSDADEWKIRMGANKKDVWIEIQVTGRLVINLLFEIKTFPAKFMIKNLLYSFSDNENRKQQIEDEASDLEEMDEFLKENNS